MSVAYATLLKALSNPDYQAIMPIVRVLKATCETDDPAVLPILLDGYRGNIHYIDGPAKALEAVGGKKAAAELVRIMERTRNRRLGWRKSDVLSAIIKVNRPEYAEAMKELKRIIETGSGQNRYYAMSIAYRYPDKSLDALFLRVAEDDGATWTDRRDALEAIGKRKMLAARPRVEALGRKHRELAQGIVFALRQIGAESSLPLLASFLNDPTYVRIHAAEAMGVITGNKWEATEDGVRAAKRWWQERKKQSVPSR